MATKYVTPGVYIEEIPKLPPSVTSVPTSMPAFIGYTEKAQDQNGGDLTNVPTRIVSILDYERLFGSAEPESNVKVSYGETRDSNDLTTGESIVVAVGPLLSLHNMHYAIRAYFANGGAPCFIVSVGRYLPRLAASATVPSRLALRAMKAGLDAVGRQNDVTLLVFPEAQNLDESDFYSLLKAALKQCEEFRNRFVITDTFDNGFATAGDVLRAANGFRDGMRDVSVKRLQYSAAYFPNLRAAFGYAYKESEVIVSHTINGIVATGSGSFHGKSLSDLKSIGAVYGKVKKAMDSYPVTLPPSPFVTGVYCSVDAQPGVWKAPANVPLAMVISPACRISAEDQTTLNVDAVSGISINAIRAFAGRGTLVWGARTLAGNDNEWRYVNVRRLIIMVEESCKRATKWVGFEPNIAPTWAKVQAMIENYLTTLWRQGALQGAKAEHAFHVAVGLGKTMTVTDVSEGRLIVEIGLAAIRPAEFIVVRFTQHSLSSV